MVKEKLRQALEDAVGYYNDGLSANDAVVKSAAEHDLTADQADRVVESFNTAKTINYFDKNASDRTGKFELASKKDVTLALFGRTPEKKASSGMPDPEPFQSFYSAPPDRSLNRKSVFADKRASFLDFCAKVAEEKWSHGYSDGTLAGMASDARAWLKSAESDAETAVGALEGYIVSATEKIAQAIRRSPYGTQEDVADLFKAACPHAGVVEAVSATCPQLKKASGGRYATDVVVDTSRVDDLLKEADGIVEAERLMAEYSAKKAFFAEKSAELDSAMLRDPSLSGLAEKAARPESLVHAPREKYAMRKSAGGFTGFVTDPVGSTTDIADTLTSVESRKNENEAILDEQRGAMLADLLSADPILQDADPRQVAAVYKSIVHSSPRVSLNKEVVRSVLRGAVNSIAFSPNDMKVLTDVDWGINRSNGPSSQKTEDEGRS